MSKLYTIIALDKNGSEVENYAGTLDLIKDKAKLLQAKYQNQVLEAILSDQDDLMICTSLDSILKFEDKSVGLPPDTKVTFQIRNNKTNDLELNVRFELLELNRYLKSLYGSKFASKHYSCAIYVNGLIQAGHTLKDCINWSLDVYEERTQLVDEYVLQTVKWRYSTRYNEPQVLLQELQNNCNINDYAEIFKNDVEVAVGVENCIKYLESKLGLFSTPVSTAPSTMTVEVDVLKEIDKIQELAKTPGNEEKILEIVTVLKYILQK